MSRAWAESQSGIRDFTDCKSLEELACGCLDITSLCMFGYSFSPLPEKHMKVSVRLMVCHPHSVR